MGERGLSAILQDGGGVSVYRNGNGDGKSDDGGGGKGGGRAGRGRFYPRMTRRWRDGKGVCDAVCDRRAHQFFSAGSSIWGLKTSPTKQIKEKNITATPDEKPHGAPSLCTQGEPCKKMSVSDGFGLRSPVIQ